MNMEEFQKEMRDKLDSIRKTAAMAAMSCAASEFEGCVLYEDLLNLQTQIDQAVSFYADEVPACDRSSIRRMVAADQANRARSFESLAP